MTTLLWLALAVATETQEPAALDLSAEDWSNSTRTSRRNAFVELATGPVFFSGGAWELKKVNNSAYEQDAASAPHLGLAVGYRAGSKQLAGEITGGFTRWQTSAKGFARQNGDRLGTGQGNSRLHTWFIRPAADLGSEKFAFRLEGYAGAGRMTVKPADYQGAPSVLGGGGGLRFGAWQGSSLLVTMHGHVIGAEEPNRVAWSAVEVLPQLRVQVPFFSSGRI